MYGRFISSPKTHEDTQSFGSFCDIYVDVGWPQCRNHRTLQCRYHCHYTWATQLTLACRLSRDPSIGYLHDGNALIFAQTTYDFIKLSRMIVDARRSAGHFF